jgi:RNA polymerase-binding transcription factor DksA
MSGYIGNPDAEAEHALILSENGINASRSMIEGPVLEDCLNCGEEINPMRVEALRKIGMRCCFCVSCQVHHDKPRSVRMLDRIL